MNTILILTKSINNEISFKNNLEKLGYEVLTSTQLTPYSSNCTNPLYKMFNYFKFTILSETLSNSEAQTTVVNLSKFSTNLIRKTDEIELRDLKNCTVINTEIQLEKLRELLADKKYNKNLPLEKTDYTKKDLLSNLGLSKYETKLILYLMENEDVAISRNDLCSYLWGKKKNPSQAELSSLSNIVKRLKQKLTDYTGNSNNLKTVWGRGYIWTWKTPDVYYSNNLNSRV